MDLVYSGEHSVNFFRIIDQATQKRNSWTDFHMIPTERPKIAVRQPNFMFVALPGTSKRIDITDFHNGGLTYGERTGSLSFYVDHRQWGSWKEAYDAVSSFLHGQQVYISLADEPSMYYMGITTVADPKPGAAYSEIKIEYDLSLDTVVQKDGFVYYYPIKFIGENGFEYASDYGEKPGTTHTKDLDDGNKSVDLHDLVTLDENMEEPTIPAYIQVTTPPVFTGPYGNGAIIGFEGLVVTAFDEDGNSLGPVPLAELIFPVTMAVYDPNAEEINKEASSDLDVGTWGQPLVISDSLEMRYVTGDDQYRIETRTIADGVFVGGYESGRSIYWYLVACKQNQGTVHIETKVYDRNSDTLLTEFTDDQTYSGYDITLDGKTAYSGNMGNNYIYPALGDWAKPTKAISGSPGAANGNANKNAAWTALYGAITLDGGVSIPIQWPRIGDGKILETSFNIIVVDVSPTE